MLKSKMRKIKILFFVGTILLFSSLSAFESEVFCEPSLIFPEIFTLEAASSFSYTLAEDLYNSNEEAFLYYLISVKFSREQLTLRYLYYLKTKQFMPALTMLMTMVNLNTYPSYFTNPYDEFFNLLQIAANDINEHSLGNETFSFENPIISSEQEKYIKSLIINDTKEPYSIRELSDMMTAELVLNFAHVKMRQKMMGREVKITPKIVFFILAASFKAILSNLEQGVNLENDPFFKELFNRFIVMQKDGRDVLSSFLYNFVEKIYGSDKEIGFYRYILLRHFGMIESVTEKWLDFKDVKAAAEWIDFVKQQENIPPFSSYFVKNEEACGYITEKTDWVAGMNHLGDESKKETAHSLKLSGIIEQCNDLAYIGLERKDNGNSEEKPYPEWAYYLSYALGKVVNSQMNADEAVSVLKKGLAAAIFAIRPADESDRNIYELMLFIYSSKNCDKILKAMFLKQIEHDNLDKNAELYNEAMKIIDDFLFY